MRGPHQVAIDRHLSASSRCRCHVCGSADASSRRMFNTYAIVEGVDQIVPVDVYAPGVPPTPETLMHAILTLHEKVRTNDITRRPGRYTPTMPDGRGVRSLATDEG